MKKNLRSISLTLAKPVVGLEIRHVKHNRNHVYKALERLFLTCFEFDVFQAGTSPDRCTQCSGTGMETVSTGPFMMRSTCRRCHGKGVFNKNPCFACRGAGQTKQRKTVKGEHNAYSFKPRIQVRRILKILFFFYFLNGTTWLTFWVIVFLLLSSIYIIG